MERPITPKPPVLPLIESREGVRGAVRSLYDYMHNFIQGDYLFKSDVFRDLNPLYGEFDWTAVAIATGAQTIITVTVKNVILGYVVQASYNQDLQGLQMTSYVSAIDTVKIVLKNDTGASVTLANGRFRCYAWPRFLST